MRDPVLTPRLSGRSAALHDGNHHRPPQGLSASSATQKGVTRLSSSTTELQMGPPDAEPARLAGSPEERAALAPIGAATALSWATAAPMRAATAQGARAAQLRAAAAQVRARAAQVRAATAPIGATAAQLRAATALIG